MPRFFYVYELVSVGDKAIRYRGITRDLKARIQKHNAGGSPHTSEYRPWHVEVAVAFRSEHKARAFEKYSEVRLRPGVYSTPFLTSRARTLSYLAALVRQVTAKTFLLQNKKVLPKEDPIVINSIIVRFPFSMKSGFLGKATYHSAILLACFTLGARPQQPVVLTPAEDDLVVLNGCVISACNYLAVVKTQHSLDKDFWAKILLVRYDDHSAGHAYCVWETDGTIYGYDRNAGSFPIPGLYARCACYCHRPRAGTWKSPERKSV